MGRGLHFFALDGDVDDSPSRHVWARRIGWMALLWAAGVAVLAVVALAFHVVMSFAGMTG